MRWVLPALLALAVACGAADSKLVLAQDLPEDVASLVDETWTDFEAAFAGRLDCMEPVSLLLVRDVPDGDAAYRSGEALIEIEIPTSPAQLPESLAHELGHHLETTCPEHAQMRASFLQAQGLLRAPGWFEGEDWEQVPSEHFAEAVVQVVNGERLLHADVIQLSPEAIEVVVHWGSGDA